MNWTLLHKYLTGECEPEELQEIEAWLRADERNQQFIDNLVQIWEVEPVDEMEVDSKAAWENFQNKIDNVESASTVDSFTTLNNRQSKSIFSVQKRYGRATAMTFSAAAVLAIAFLFYQYYPPMMSVAETGAEAPQSREIVTERGQRTTLQLIDGTRIQLNSNSKIEIPANYNDSTRTVRLEGEGFFEVVHDPSMPFIVQSGDTYTKVLGTKFGVRSYSAEGRIQVVVAEGRVALGHAQSDAAKQEMLIRENQKGTISQTGASELTGVDDLEQYLGWRNGKLVFDDLPFAEVVPELERWYDIEITLKDSCIAQNQLKATFTKEPITEVLNVIALSLDIEYEREGQRVIFKKR